MLLICRTVIIIIPPITLHSAIHCRQLRGSSSCASEPVSSWDVSDAVRNTSNLWSRGKLSENDQISLLLPTSHNHKPSEIASQCCTDPLDPCKPSGQLVCGATLMISTLWNNRSFNFTRVQTSAVLLMHTPGGTPFNLQIANQVWWLACWPERKKLNPCIPCLADSVLLLWLKKDCRNRN